MQRSRLSAPLLSRGFLREGATDRTEEDEDGEQTGKMDYTAFRMNDARTQINCALRTKKWNSIHDPVQELGIPFFEIIRATDSG